MTNQSMSETMIEQVARAICYDFCQYEGDTCSYPCAKLGKCQQPIIDDCFLRDARAAIAAMREPSESIINAGAEHTWEDGYNRDGSHATGTYVSYDAGLATLFGDHGKALARIYAEEVWQAMIDTALGEG